MGQVAAAGISFKNANIQTPDDALINYLKEHTGKMKSLVAADLDFFLTTGKQLLNIGKPFYIEGIGTLTKNKDGNFAFSPGDYLVAKVEDLRHPERRPAPSATASYEEPPREDPKGNSMRQTLLLVGIVGGLIAIAWGGYYLYKRNNYTEPTSENRARVIPETTTTKPVDTSALAGNRPAGDSASGSSTPPKDTALANAGAKNSNPADASAAKPVTPSPTTAAAKSPTTTAATTQPVAHDPVPTGAQSLYRFIILRTENKNHAIRRYNQLLGYQLNIKMETKDSTFFKLYFPIAATIRDTTHIRDSLADVYASKVSIEH